jgi:hypothetical protein
MKAHATFEIMYNGLEKQNTELSRDTIQLLKVFSFSNVRLYAVTCWRRRYTTAKLKGSRSSTKIPQKEDDH